MDDLGKRNAARRWRRPLEPARLLNEEPLECLEIAADQLAASADEARVLGYGHLPHQLARPRNADGQVELQLHTAVEQRVILRRQPTQSQTGQPLGLGEDPQRDARGRRVTCGRVGLRPLQSPVHLVTKQRDGVPAAEVHDSLEFRGSRIPACGIVRCVDHQELSGQALQRFLEEIQIQRPHAIPLLEGEAAHLRPASLRAGPQGLVGRHDAHHPVALLQRRHGAVDGLLRAREDHDVVRRHGGVILLRDGLAEGLGAARLRVPETQVEQLLDAVAQQLPHGARLAVRAAQQVPRLELPPLEPCLQGLQGQRPPVVSRHPNDGASPSGWAWGVLATRPGEWGSGGLAGN
mmetsp:Transcript_35641/g.111223  ORF Transcript_35641/g.111223 Transcript_35641/m.111223 type:complete len:349 (-) Transcript_35641:2-1048(-)